MKQLLLSIALVLCVPLGASAHSYYTNEPAGSTQITACTFNTSDFCNAVLSTVAPGRWYNLYPSSETALGSDASEPRSPNGFLDFIHTYTDACNNGGATPLNCAVGGGQVGYIDNKVVRELFGGFTFKINNGYGCNLPGSSKVVLPRALDNRLGFMQTNGVFNIRGCGPTKQFVWSHNSGNNDNSHICATAVGLRCDPNVGSGNVPEGVWVKIEFCIRSSTTNTSRDGVVKWWINGAPAGSYLTINYGNGNVNEVAFNQTFDGYGNGQGFTMTVHQQIGDAYLSSSPNGGCASGSGSGGGGDTTPPSKATGVVVTQLN